MKTLKKSPNKDQDVIVLQNKLNLARAKVHGNWDNLAPDGIFGDKTEIAVKAFQTYSNISKDGIVGPQTWKKIEDICSYKQLDEPTLGNFTIVQKAIIQKAIENNIKSISFFWTNVTKFNAKVVAREIQRLYPNINIKVFEATLKGIKMEKHVNRKLVEEGLRQAYEEGLRLGYKKAELFTFLNNKKAELFTFLKKNELWGRVLEKAPLQYKQKLQAFQRRKSILYAKSAKNSDWIIRFKEVYKELGQASIAEQKILEKTHKTVETYSFTHKDILKRVMNPDGSTRLITHNET